MRVIATTLISCWFCWISSQCLGAEIDHIDLRLYLSHSGSLSAPLEHKAELWNVIIGGGIPEPSTSTLVDVVVSAGPDTEKNSVVVNLVATNQRSGKVLLRQSKTVGVFSPEGKFHAAFWLSETGCVPLRLVATLKGTTKSKTVSLPFECGE